MKMSASAIDTIPSAAAKPRRKTPWFRILFYGASVGLSLPTVAGYVGGYFLVNLDNGKKKPLEFDLAGNVLSFFDYLKTRPLNDVDTMMPWQDVLMAMGYDLGKCGADGMYSDKTKAAFSAYMEKKNLPYDKGWAPIFESLYQDIKASPQLQAHLDAVILKPFRRPDVRIFMATLSDRFSWSADTAVLYRPDVYAAATLNNFFGASPDQLNEEGKEIYGGCANNKQIDAYRHGAYLLDRAKYTISGGNAISAALNLRERTGNNEPGILLTDLFNHMKAEEISYSFSPLPWRNPEPRSVIVNAINNNVFATRPFPLVPMQK